jgi:hypothetical protein
VGCVPEAGAAGVFVTHNLVQLFMMKSTKRDAGDNMLRIFSIIDESPVEGRGIGDGHRGSTTPPSTGM